MHHDLVGIIGAGVLTFASPCILPLVPIYLALVSGASVGELRSGQRVRRAVATAIAFSVGLSLVFTLFGMAATALGHSLLAHRALLLQLGGLAVFLFGLKQLGVLHVPWLDRDVRPGLQRVRGGSVLGALAVGVAFGLGWTPCVGPILGSVLTYTASATSNPLVGARYLAAYAAGIAVPLILAAAAAPVALGWLQRLNRWTRPIQMATGGLLCVVGLLLLTDRIGVLDPSSWSPVVPAASASSASSPGGTDTPLCAASTAGAHACAVPDVSPVAAAASGQHAETTVAGPSMIEFVGHACPICLRMTPVVQAAERDCSGHGVRFQRIEVDGAEGRAKAHQFGVIGVPTFVFLDGRGEEVARLVGEQPLAELEQSLQVLSGARCAGFRTLQPGS